MGYLENDISVLLKKHMELNLSVDEEKRLKKLLPLYAEEELQDIVSDIEIDVGRLMARLPLESDEVWMDEFIDKLSKKIKNI